MFPQSLSCWSSPSSLAGLWNPKQVEEGGKTKGEGQTWKCHCWFIQRFPEEAFSEHRLRITQTLTYENNI